MIVDDGQIRPIYWIWISIIAFILHIRGRLTSPTTAQPGLKLVEPKKQWKFVFQYFRSIQRLLTQQKIQLPGAQFLQQLPSIHV